MCFLPPLCIPPFTALAEIRIVARLTRAVLVSSFLVEATSARAQITVTDTENQTGTTLAIISRAGFGNPKGELIARYGAGACVLTAITNLLGQSGLPWQIAVLVTQIGQLDKEIESLDGMLATLGADIAKILNRISALNPAEPNYVTQLAQLQAVLAAKQLSQTRNKTERDALLLQREALQPQLASLGASPFSKYAQSSLNDFCAELRNAGTQVTNAVLADLPDAPVLLFNDAALRSTNSCCWGQNFAEVTNFATVQWFLASSSGALQGDAGMRSPNRDYSYNMSGGLVTVNVEVFTHYYGFLVVDLRASDGLVITNFPILPWGRQGSTYDLQLATTGGLPIIVFSTPTCSLPPGLALRSDGRLHGVPASYGVFCFAVQAVDAASQTNAARFRLFITPAVLPRLHLQAHPQEGNLWPLTVWGTPGFWWEVEESTNLVDWVASPFSMEGALGTNVATRYLESAGIRSRRYFRGALLPW